nr:MAG TPA: hypothetical protein [Caudoviricetes sp.]
MIIAILINFYLSRFALMLLIMASPVRFAHIFVASLWFIVFTASTSFHIIFIQLFL